MPFIFIRKFALLLCLASLYCLAFSTQAQAAAYEISQDEWASYMSKSDFKKADADMTEAYKKLLKSIPREYYSVVIQGQRSWTIQREKAAFSKFDKGSEDYRRFLMSEARERTAIFKKYADWVEKEKSAGKSIFLGRINKFRVSDDGGAGMGMLMNNLVDDSGAEIVHLGADFELQNSSSCLPEGLGTGASVIVSGVLGADKTLKRISLVCKKSFSQPKPAAAQPQAPKQTEAQAEKKPLSKKVLIGGAALLFLLLSFIIKCVRKSGKKAAYDYSADDNIMDDESDDLPEVEEDAADSVNSYLGKTQEIQKKCAFCGNTYSYPAGAVVDQKCKGCNAPLN